MEGSECCLPCSAVSCEADVLSLPSAGEQDYKEDVGADMRRKKVTTMRS